MSLPESFQEIKTFGLAPETCFKITLRTAALFKSIPLRFLTINNVQLTLSFTEYSYRYCMGRSNTSIIYVSSKEVSFLYQNVKGTYTEQLKSGIASRSEEQRRFDRSSFRTD